VSESKLLWGLLFSSVGVGFFLYGKQQRSIVPLVCGLALMIYPYFVTNVLGMVAVGIGLSSIPYFFRK
jgi:membrane protein DedA with SNARE-associated domain